MTSRGRGRPRQFDKDAALTRAMEVFWSKGYLNASMSDLTQAMGIASPSLYAAFGGKEALYEECLKLYVERFGGDMWRQLEVTPSLADAVEAFLRCSATAFADSAKPPGCMVLTGLQEAVQIGASAAWLRSQWRSNQRKMVRRFERAIADGDAPSGFDCSAAADFILTLQIGQSATARLSLPRARLLSVARLGRQAVETMIASA